MVQGCEIVAVRSHTTLLMYSMPKSEWLTLGVGSMKPSTVTSCSEIDARPMIDDPRSLTFGFKLYGSKPISWLTYTSL